MGGGRQPAPTRQAVVQQLGVESVLAENGGKAVTVAVRASREIWEAIRSTGFWGVSRQPGEELYWSTTPARPLAR